jgi:hypothetical protein
MPVFFASPPPRRVPDWGGFKKIGCSRRSALGVVRIELIAQNVDGDFGHEENRFVSNGAGNGVWFGFRC